MVDRIEGMSCYKCKAPVCKDEAAITKKLVNRGTNRYYCMACLAEAFDISTEDIRRSIKHYKNIGCTLFQ